ncbi:hypothetical protein CDCA_CDCA10G2863 [Cyanidium caldarium]|uniref:Mitogen-activated protein kinase n=1 Tax=Cyanidium caldarium TaxID=2771 RepID=A0AAV9IYF4_CYACA|nr:hypothetical protein CDCA_CDCA10G2863 [Cyanidium caldarium]
MSQAHQNKHHVEELRRSFFDVPLVENRYTLLSVIGEGAYGVVCSAMDNRTGEKVAVKRIRRVFDEVPEAIRILRELRFLRLLRSHENIITVRDVMAPSHRDEFNDVFVVFELMPADLNRVLRAKIALSQDHIRWLLYQLLRALHFMHSCNVLHRDIKPNNIMINEMCDLRVIDFGLARAAYSQQHEDMVYWTDYVATRWYRAPELIMSYFTRYSTAIDVWSVGCIFAELLNQGRPLFPGMNGFHQLELMVRLLGSPGEEAISKVRNTKAKQHLRSLPQCAPRPLQEVFPDAPPEGHDLLQHLLQFDPDRRYTALQALQHPYFRDLFSVESVVTGAPLPAEEFRFEREQLSQAQLRELFLEEISHYHPDLLEVFRSTAALGYEVPSEAEKFRDALANEESDGLRRPRAYASMPKERLATMWSQVERWARGRERGNGKAPAGIRHVSTVPEASDEVIMEEPTEAGADVIADAAATATTSDLPVTAMDESLMEEVVVVAAAASTASRTGDTGGRVCASHVTGNAR